MNIQPTSSLNNYLQPAKNAASNKPPPSQPTEGTSLNARGVDETELRETFTQFVGETFFTELIKSMRSSLGKPAYFHGGRAEEVFQGQLDQMLSERFAETAADEIANPMYELFQLNRQR